MKTIKFKSDTELEVISKFNEATDNIDESSNEVFKAGSTHEVTIIDGDVADYCDIQFPNGNLVLGVYRHCFTIE